MLLKSPWRRLNLAAAVGVLLAGLAISPAAAHETEYALAGDSTMAPNDGNDGWGDALIHHLPEGNRVANHGANGRSTKSFINEGRWQKVLELKPDVVLIQFGHNDQKIDKPSRGAYPVDDPEGVEASPHATPEKGSDLYRENLRLMVASAKAIGARPILVTPVARRRSPYDSAEAQTNWNTTPQATDSFGNHYSLRDYADATIAVATEEEIPLIDLNKLSLELYAEMIANGEDISSLGPKGDDTHFNLNGMSRIAALVGRALEELASQQ